MNNEHRVRELAYQIWQSEGCPDGDHHRHWEMACRLAEAEQQQPTATAPENRTRKPATKPTEATAASMPSADTSVLSDVQTPAMTPPSAPATKPRATRTKATAAAPKAPTEAEAGSPAAIKKPRAPRKKKET